LSSSDLKGSGIAGALFCLDVEFLCYKHQTHQGSINTQQARNKGFNPPRHRWAAPTA